MRFFSLRALFLIGFVVAMPVLALPPVARRVDELLYGPPPGDFGRPAAAQPLAQETIRPPITEGASPAASLASGSAPRGLDAMANQPPPPLATSPTFAPPLPAQTSSPSSEAPADPPLEEATLARLEQIRQRLEQLGAEYVIAESLEESKQFHFHCRMLVDPQSRFTKPFEATHASPVTAAEEVLRDVETWYTAARAAPPLK